MVNETRMKLASLGCPRERNGELKLIDQQKFGATQFQEQVNYQRALEGELTKSICRCRVQSARIHPAIPEAIDLHAQRR